MSMIVSRIARLLFVLAIPVTLHAQDPWTLNTAGTEVSTDKQVRVFGGALPQFTLDAQNEARIQFKIGGATKFLVNHDGTNAALGTQTAGGDVRVLSNGFPRMIVTSIGPVAISTVHNGYTLHSETLGTHLFSLDTGAGGYGRAGLLVANGGASAYPVKGNPLGREYGMAGIVGSAADGSGGGRHTIGVYGYTLFNGSGVHTNQSNLQTAGMFISELNAAVTDFRAPMYGVYARADARAASGTNPAAQIGVHGEAHGRPVDWAIGGYFTASSGVLRRGIQVSSIEAASNNYSFYSDATAKSYFAGSIGIGTMNPTAKLHVAGDAVIDGNIAAKYQDFAEWVPATEDLEPGTVVVLDPALPNHVIASSRPYDTTVAGVVSAQPGIILGEAGASKEQIATTGRVKVRVDATTGAVRIGDLLVSSDKSGTAMKSHPIDVGGVAIHRPGTVIGKALEPLEGGVGEILVLLSLQ